MIVAATLVFLYWLVVHALFLWTAAHWFNVYVTLLAALLYVPSYLDGKEYTGERQWRALREWRVWRRVSPVLSHFNNKRDLDAVNHRSMRLYIAVPGKTLAATVWGIGLHGGTLSPFADRLHFVVPPLLMAVPLLRDALLWAGAVTYHTRRLPLTDLILQLLQSNRSVCYAPCSVLTGTQAFPHEQQQTGPLAVRIDLALFQFALANRVQLVPVLVQNEDAHYWTLHAPRLQAWTQARLGYAWPHVTLPRRGPKMRSIQQVFGSILHCEERYPNAQALSEAFCKSFAGLSCPDLDEEEYQVVGVGSDESF